MSILAANPKSATLKTLLLTKQFSGCIIDRHDNLNISMDVALIDEFLKALQQLTQNLRGLLLGEPFMLVEKVSHVTIGAEFQHDE